MNGDSRLVNQAPTLSLVPVELAPLPAPCDNPALTYVRRLAPGSRSAVTSALRQLLGTLGDDINPFTFPWEGLRHTETSAIRAALAARLAPATTNRALAVLRGVLQEAWLAGLMGHEEMARASHLPSVRGSRLKAGRHVPVGEQRALFEACAADRSPLGRRDALVLALGFGCGLRRAEIAGLRIEDFSPSTSRATVLGKGGQEREIPLPAGTRRYLEALLAARVEHAHGPINPADSLIVSVRKGGHLTTNPITGQTICLLLARRAREAGIEPVTPHDMRRTYIGSHLEAGTGLEIAQQLAGHNDPKVTSGYDRRPATVRDAAADNIVVPYVAPTD